MAVNLIPIHPSTPLRTRKGTVSVYGEDFRGGPLIEPARTNKVTCRKANPVDTTGLTSNRGILTIVDASAALEAAGLKGHVNSPCTSGKVYRYDCSIETLGDCSVPVSSINSAIHTLSAYVRVVSGSGGRVRLAGIGETLFTNTDFQRISYTNTVASNGGLTIRAEGGSVVEFILPQHEEGAFATSPIALASDGSDPLTTLTRPAANLTRPTAGTALETGNNFAIYGRVVPKATPLALTVFALCSCTTADDADLAEVIIYNVVRFRKRKNTETIYEVNSGITPAADVTFEYIAYQHSASGMGISVRQYTGSTWGAWSNWVTRTDANGVASFAPAATYQIGARNNALHFAANYPFTKIIALNPALNPQTWLMSQLALGRI